MLYAHGSHAHGAVALPKDPHRKRRIESELQRVLSDLLRREVNDPRVGSITITAVQVAPDLGHAKILYTQFGRERDAKEVKEGLQGVARFLRGQVARALKLRVAPELHFEPDVQLMEGMRLTALIDAAVASDDTRHSDSPAQPDSDDDSAN